MSGVYIEVNQEDVRRVQKKLKDLEKAPQKLKNAINRTATQTMKMIRAGRSAGYTVKAGRFNSDIKRYNASAGRLEATIRASGRPPTIKNFKTSMPKSGGKADITKSGLKPIKTDAAGAAFSMKGLMTQRRGRERFPVKVIYGNSTPKMVEKIYKGERGGQGNMEGRIREKLHEEMLKEIQKLM